MLCRKDQGADKAVESGAITRQRLDESVPQVLRLKVDRGIIPNE